MIPFVDHGHFVATNMWMGIGLGRFSVCSPACVSDTKTAMKIASTQHIFKLRNLARCSDSPNLTGTVDHRDAGGVIPPILESLETIDQQRYHITLGDGPHYSTHAVSLRLDCVLDVASLVRDAHRFGDLRHNVTARATSLILGVSSIRRWWSACCATVLNWPPPRSS